MMPNIFQKRKSHGEMANPVITTCDTLVNGYTDEFKDAQILEADRRRKEIECYVNKLKQAGGGNAREFAIDVEKVLKKTHDGIASFEDLFEKFHTTNNAGLRRNYEKGMRTEIKKIQRLRDQIKIWLLMGDAKDPETMLSIKSDIENRMQRFRALEHDVRVRDYSDSTLANLHGGKIPRVIEDFSALSKWLTIRLNLFDTEINIVESQLEEIVSGSRKKMDQEMKDREERLKSYLEKHNHHVSMLEKLLRLLNNLVHDITSPALPEFIEQVDNIKDGIDYYLDDYQNEDYEDNEFLYDDIKALKDYQEIIDNPITKLSSNDESEEKEEGHNTTGLSELNEATEKKSASGNDTDGSSGSRKSGNSSKSLPNIPNTKEAEREPLKWSIADLVNKRQQITDAHKLQEQNGEVCNGSSSLLGTNEIFPLLDDAEVEELKKLSSANIPPPASTTSAAGVMNVPPTQVKSTSIQPEEDFPILGEVVLPNGSAAPQLWSSIVDTKLPCTTSEITVNRKLINPTSFCMQDPVVLPRPMIRKQEKTEVPSIKAEYNITTGQSYVFATPKNVYTSTPIGSRSQSPNTFVQEPSENVATVNSIPNGHGVTSSGPGVNRNYQYQSITAANQRLMEARHELLEHKKAARHLAQEIRYLEQLTGFKGRPGLANGGASGDDYESDESEYFSPNSSPPQPVEQEQYPYHDQPSNCSLPKPQPITTSKLHYSPTFTLCKLSALTQVVDFAAYTKFDDNVFFQMYYNKADPYYASFATGILQYRGWRLGIEDDMWYNRIRGPFLKYHKLMSFYCRYNPMKGSYEYVEVPVE